MTDWPDQLHVGVVGGTRLPGNVRTLLRNIRDLLRDHPTTFECDLIVCEDVDPPDGYAVVDPGIQDTDRAIGTLRTLLCAVYRYAKRATVDVLVQVTKFPLHGCVTALAGRRSGTPVLARFAGDNFREYRFSDGIERVKIFGLNNILGRVPVTLADRIIVLGPYLRSEIERRNEAARVDQIPQPVDRDRFSPVTGERERDLKDELDFSKGNRVLLTVGRLTARKGMDTVIETARRLTERGLDFRWYVLGEGPMQSDLAATPNVEPRGHVAYDRVADYYRASDLVVHPSLFEGLPNVLLEAAACGTPTVARDVGDSSVAASSVFTDDDQLPSLLLDHHEPVTLGERFDSDRLREAYARAVVATANGSE